jgi:ribonuclease P/MRP protein subunit RPP40
MQFNVSKVMYMGTSNPGYQYQMSGQVLQTTDEERDIGVMISANLKPAAQCAKAAKTVQAVLGQLVRAFHYRDRHVFMRLYKQYVRPHLEFSTQAWSPWTEGDKACLEKVEQRAVRMVSGLKSGEYSERLSELGQPTLEERRHQADMAMVHKILCGRGSLDSNQWFERAAGTVRATRSSANPVNLKMRQGCLEIRRNFFSNRVVSNWNDIPSDIRETAKSENFQRKYKQLRATR